MKPQPKLSIQELTSIAEEFLQFHYQLSLTIPILYNGRLTSNLGRCFFTLDDEPIEIELSKRLGSYHPEHEIIEVLKHELVHYALCILKKPYGDGEEYFEQELIRVGVSSTEHITYKGIVYIYECAKCYEPVLSERKISHAFVSVCCEGDLVLRDTVIVTGQEFNEQDGTLNIHVAGKKEMEQTI